MSSASPNKPAPSNPAMTLQLNAGSHRRRVGEPERSVKITTLTGLVTICILLAGCMHSKRTYIQVVDSLSGEPLASAKITACLYDRFHPDAPRTHIKEVLTRSNGLALVKIPMCSTRGVEGGYLYDTGGGFAGRTHPNSMVGPELIIEREGYVGSAIYHSNSDWQNEDTSRQSPFVVELDETRAEPGGVADRSQPSRSETKRTPGAAGSRR